MADVDTSGPIFDGRADAALILMSDDIEKTLARAGADMVRQNLGGVLRHPTGYYESQIDAEPSGGGWEVTDGGVIYGPWLEGVGSRNRTTRFKGYATFRRTSQQLDSRSGELSRAVADRYIGRMD